MGNCSKGTPTKDFKRCCKCERGEVSEAKKRACRNFIDWPDDHNCCLVAVEKHGEMNLRDVADRLGISYVRVQQIEKRALKKLANMGLKIDV